jgi:hypothetical protein
MGAPSGLKNENLLVGTSVEAALTGIGFDPDGRIDMLGVNTLAR